MKKIELLEMRILGIIEGYLPMEHYLTLKRKLIPIFKEAKQDED
jgi:hypothetical protein